MKLTSTNSSIGLIVTVMKVETGSFYIYDEFVSLFGSSSFEDFRASLFSDFRNDCPNGPKDSCEPDFEPRVFP